MIDITVSGLSPTTKILAKVELYEGSTLVRTCTCSDSLKDFKVERYGEDSKFFGTCVSQKLRVEFADLWREIEITNKQHIKVAYIIGDITIYPYPTFYVYDVSRDEDNNNITAVAYDAIYNAEGLTVADLMLPAEGGYTILDVAEACAEKLGCAETLVNIESTDAALQLALPLGGNFDGSETVKAVLKSLAEATQTICYIGAPDEDGQPDKLVFQRLDKENEPVYTVGRNKYYKLKTEAARTLGQLCHTTELGDNLITSLLAEDNEVQYIRNNPFFESLESAALADFLEDEALAAIGGLSITPFYCEWVGDCRLEIGDKIELEREDGSKVISYLLDSVVTFDGVYEEVIEWVYSTEEAETDSNPTSLGEVLNKTFARVDKAEKNITLAVSDLNNQGGRLTKLELDTEGLTTTVTNMETTMNDSIDGINDNLETLTRTVETKVSAEQVSISIKQELENGVDKVTTSTGFTFNEEGLTVSKSDSEMSTQITEDGMRIYRDDEEMLTADHTGVNATNLHATTYLMVGGRSRFENYGSDRTGCFWIGGND